MIAKKSQAAMEFLMTYGWAILVVLVCISALSYFGVFSSPSLLPKTCTFPSGISCMDFSVEQTGETSKINFFLKNNMGDTLENVDFSIDGCPQIPPIAAWSADESKTISLTDCTLSSSTINPTITYKKQQSGLTFTEKGTVNIGAVTSTAPGSSCSTPEECNDDKECTIDACNSGTCSNPPKSEGDSCSQGVCDGNSNCVECSSIWGNCDDGESCTTDTCGINKECQHTQKTCDNSALDGCCPVGCPANQDIDCNTQLCGNNMQDPYEKCDQDWSEETLTTTGCNDGVDNDEDGYADCDDPGCRVTSHCGCIGCDDSNSCTKNDCDQQGCINTAIEGIPCDDGYYCTEDETCQNKVCVGGTPRTCEDGLFCTKNDRCDESQDSCVYDANCIDNNQCTEDYCDEMGDSCSNSPKAEGTPCNDNNACTLNDYCSGETCTYATSTTCQDDGNPCTSESCNPSTGDCERSNLPDGTACEDGDACTTGDTCQSGSCISGPVDCGISGCEYSQHSCDDGNPCTTGEYCYSGICQGGSGCSEGQYCCNNGCCNQECDAYNNCV